MLVTWRTIDAYLDIPSRLDLDYARLLYAACHASKGGAYEWLEFCDLCGIDDPGDYYDDVDYL